ncbi:hypothetical protein ACFL08_04070 [Patescibacteria group bacterium]
MDKIVKNITIGIRHKRTFKIRDHFGKFIDRILHASDSPFSTTYFPFLDEKTSNSFTLHNKDNEYFQINADDFVVSLKSTNNFQKDILHIKDTVLPFIKKRLFNITEISDISRIGIIFSLEITSKNELNKLISFFTNSNIKSTNDFDMRFSQKIPVSESLVKKNINDYINIIYSLVKDKNKLFINIDYQRYFEPELRDINDFDLNGFIESATATLNNSYNNWLKNYEERKGSIDTQNSTKESSKKTKKKAKEDSNKK